MTKKSLSRRSLLRGLGSAGLGTAGLGSATLASPFLRSFEAQAQAGVAKPKLIIYASASGWLVGPNGGSGYEGWLPSSLHSGNGQAEATFAGNVVPILEPLARHADNILVVDNLRGSEGVGTHMQAPTMLTGGGINNGERPRSAGGDGDFQADSKSIDHAIAEALGSRVLGLAHNIDGFQRGEGYLSHTERGRPFIPIQDQQEAYDRVFDSVGAVPVDPAIPNTSLARRRRILDSMRGDIARLHRRLPAADRARLQEHLAHVERLESEAVDAPSEPMPTCSLGERPEGYGARDAGNMPRQLASYMSTMVSAMGCGFSQVGFIQAGNLEGSTRAAWPEYDANVRYNEHAISHKFDGEDGAGSDGLSQADARQLAIKVQQMHSSLFAGMLDQLAATPDVDGSPMLDNTIVLHIKPMGRNHNRTHLMWLVAGGRNLGIQGNRYLRLGGAKYVNDMLVSVANAMGVGMDSFGRGAQNTGAINLG